LRSINLIFGLFGGKDISKSGKNREKKEHWPSRSRYKNEFFRQLYFLDWKKGLIYPLQALSKKMKSLSFPGWKLQLNALLNYKTK